MLTLNDAQKDCDGLPLDVNVARIEGDGRLVDEYSGGDSDGEIEVMLERDIEYVTSADGVPEPQSLALADSEGESE